MSIVTNVKPYYDDFDSTKNYHKILFAPGRPLQARELTQMQTMLQNQIKSAGDFLLKNGSMVIPGHIFYDNTLTAVKLESTYDGNQVNGYLSSFMGEKVIGVISGVAAEVLFYTEGEGIDPPTIYVKFVSGGSAFAAGEKIAVAQNGSLIVQSQNLSQSGSSIVTIKEGIYYINGYFVQVLEQKIILDKYSANPNYIVGLELAESISTVTEDSTLYDNSRGFVDYVTVGADRLKISLTLVKRQFAEDLVVENASEVKFIDLLHIRDGIILHKKDKSDLGAMESILARRTYDESGDYTLIPHKITAQHYRSNVRGAWASGIAYIAGDVVTSNGRDYECLNGNISGISAPAHAAGVGSDGALDWMCSSIPYNNLGAIAAVNSESYDIAMRNDGLVALNITPGKSYIKGYEVNANAGRLVVEKPRTFTDVSSQVIPTDVGLYYLIDNVLGVPDIANMELLTIKNSINQTVGSCRARNIEPIGNSQYKLYVFDIKFDGMTGSVQNSSFSDGFKVFTGTTYTFSAKSVVELIPLQGTVNTSASTVSGFGTLLTSLNVGDCIRIGSVQTGVSAITDANQMTTFAAVGTQTGQIVYYVSSPVKGNISAPITQLPITSIRTLHTGTSFDTSYTVRRIYSGNISGGAVTLSIPNGNGDKFAAGNLNYVIVLASGVHVTPTAANLSNFNQTVSLTTAETGAVKVIASVLKTNTVALEKTKILKTKTLTFLTYDSVKGTYLNLQEADIVRIASVKKNVAGAVFSSTTPTTSVPFVATGAIDITSSFSVDSGIKVEYYGLGSAIKLAGVVIDRPIEITFDYFEHSNGDYFSVDSYRNIPYHMIPNGVSDVLDFRPRISDAGDWTGTGRSIPEPVSTQNEFMVSISHYLGRKDLVVVHSDASYEIITGEPAIVPVAPKNIPDDSIVISEVSYSPYCGNINMVEFTGKSTKRYTMKDIGNIDARLKNVEYYTALSLLEKKTADQKVVDAFGLDRYKNGFLTDAFDNHESGYVNHPDYSNSIDSDAGELRPFFVPSNIKLYEARPESRLSQGYTITGDIASLPYTTTPVLSQKLANIAELINPYAVFGFRGVTTLFPNEDTWVDITQLPNILIKKEGNFNTIQSLATKAGMLGTVWKSWKETGRTLKSHNVINSSTSETVKWQTQTWETPASPNLVARNYSKTTTKTYKTDVYNWSVDQTRTGTNTYVQESWDEVGRETNVVESKFLPWMRARPVLIQSKGLKPYVDIFTNINNRNATAENDTIVTIVLSEKPAINFRGYEDTEILNDQRQARHDNKYGSQFIWDRGDVITLANGLTGIVVDTDFEEVGGTGKYVLKVANLQHGSLSYTTLYDELASHITVGMAITGSVSGALGTVESFYKNNNSTNSLGNFWAVQYIKPGTYPCGNVDVILSDIASADPSLTTTWGQTVYSAQGKLESKQTTITTVRNGQIVSVPVVQNRNVSATTSTTVQTGTSSKTTLTAAWVIARGGGDPLAQTFSLRDTGGCFISSVDIFFHTVEANIPVKVEIRDVVNGYPGPNIVPFGQKIISANTILKSTTSLVPTTFTFPSLVYLQPDVEYCVVVLCDSNKTKIWCAQAGSEVPDITNPSRRITEQPLIGSLFKSQNNSAWVAEPSEDMTLVINKAVFDISREGEMALFNASVPATYIGENPLTSIAGSDIVRVDHVAHGMKDGDFVSFISTDSYPGLSDGETFVVSNAQFESYTITWPDVLTTSSSFGGKLFASQNLDANIVRFSSSDMVVAGTNIRYGFSVSENRTMPDLRNCQLNEDISLYSPAEVLSEENTSRFLSNTNVIAGVTNRPVVFDVFMSSTNPNVSPIFDLQNASMTAIANKINIPSASMNTGHNNSEILSATSVTFLVNGFTTTNTTLFDEFDMFEIGKDIVVSGSRTGSTFITNVSSTSTSRTVYTNKADWTTGAASVTIIQKNDYVREIAPYGSSSLFKYVSSQMQLSAPATSANIYFDYNISNSAEISVFYKTSKVSLSENILEKPWVEHIPDSSELLIVNADPSVFSEAKFSIDGLDEYDQILVKLVGNSEETANVPRIKNFRLIALA